MMEKIKLMPITKDNFDDVIDLTDTLSDFQKNCVAPNVYSLAEALANGKRLAWPRAIYLGDKPIGFVMVALDSKDIPPDDKPGYYLWRMMVALPYQNKGYGRQALDIIKKKCRRDGMKTFYTSCSMKGPEPYRFYIHYGFTDTGLNDGEQILKMYL